MAVRPAHRHGRAEGDEGAVVAAQGRGGTAGNEQLEHISAFVEQKLTYERLQRLNVAVKQIVDNNNTNNNNNNNNSATTNNNSNNNNSTTNNNNNNQQQLN